VGELQFLAPRTFLANDDAAVPVLPKHADRYSDRQKVTPNYMYAWSKTVQFILIWLLYN